MQTDFLLQWGLRPLGGGCPSLFGNGIAVNVSGWVESGIICGEIFASSFLL